MILVERYAKFLSSKNSRGDIIIESRGKKEDAKLKSILQMLCKNGTDYIKSEELNKRLTSKNLKFAKKENRVAGIEISDMLAIPMKLFTLVEYDVILDIENDFIREITELARPKIRTCPFTQDKIKGFGIVFKKP